MQLNTCIFHNEIPQVQPYEQWVGKTDMETCCEIRGWGSLKQKHATKNKDCNADTLGTAMCLWHCHFLFRTEYIQMLNPKSCPKCRPKVKKHSDGSKQSLAWGGGASAAWPWVGGFPTILPFFEEPPKWPQNSVPA